MFIYSDTFKGDEYGYGLFKKFLDGYVEKFHVDGLGHICMSKEDLIKKLFKSPSHFDTCLGGHKMETQEEFKIYMTAIADYTREFMNSCSAQRFVEHYEPEWKNIENGYHIAQYNAMKLSSVLKNFSAKFTRTQLYEIHKLRVHKWHEGKNSAVISTCSNGIDEFGISNPEPRYIGVKDEPKFLSTESPDIAILKPLFDKYKLVRWDKEQTKERYFISKHQGYDCGRIYGLLNELKYKHLNINKKGRRILDIKSKQVHYDTNLDTEIDVTGYWKNNYTGKHLVGKHKVGEHQL